MQVKLLFILWATQILSSWAIPTNSSLRNYCSTSNFNDARKIAHKCSTLSLDSIVVPAGKTLHLKLKNKAHLTIKGHWVFEHKAWEGPLLIIEGNGITVQGENGHVLDGNGPKYWEGKQHKPSAKPKFIKIRTTGGAVLKGISVKNCPVQCVSVNSEDTTLDSWRIDNYAGQPGVAPSGHEGHNTDGFDVSRSQNVHIKNAVVINQDDCVAVNSGKKLTFEDLTCTGSHGLSLSVGDGNGEDNVVEDVHFINCEVIDSDNAIHVKTKPKGGKGKISKVTYENIKVQGIHKYVVNVQQDYNNEGNPSNNVPINDLVIKNVEGTMKGKNSVPVYIICATGGCNNWKWSNLKVTGNSEQSRCIYKPVGIACK